MVELVKLFISGFPLEITELELVQMVSPCGEVSAIKIIRDKATRKCKGYAFIEVANREAADNVIEALDGTRIGDRELTISIKEDELVRPAPVYKKVDRPTGLVKKKRPRRQI